MRRALFAALALVLAGCGSHAKTAGVTTPGAPPGERTIAIGGCEGVYYEREGRPQLLLVSDFPLESSLRTAMHQMTQAVKLTLKDRNFRAGRFDVGYVVCDDSGPDGHYDAGRCAGNARRLERVAKSVAVIGGVDSACARAQLGVLAPAKVALIGTIATADDLTGRHAPFLRLSASRSAQAAAAATALRDQGARTVLVTSDGSAAGDAFAAAFYRAAAALGLRSVAHGKADAAYVAGSLLDRAGPALRAARASVGKGTVVVPETLGPASLLAAVAGSAADGVQLAVGGIPVASAGTAGRAWVAHFEGVLHAEPHPYAAYAAQAATLLLDAIGRSDGSRASVAAAARTVEAPGPLGEIPFTAGGEPKRPVVSFFRVHGGRAQFLRAVSVNPRLP